MTPKKYVPGLKLNVPPVMGRLMLAPEMELEVVLVYVVVEMIGEPSGTPLAWVA